ncbi:hypothetical protein [Nocardia paucivorans]|uniref:hypothetical protein n=1 Tax=Nocardia paucivorans TaxID=114259 RepID=UPI0012FCF7C2|nr:hypothetical protein [Nocardia paucivorans]
MSIAAEISRALGAMKDLMSEHDSCWGRDRTGKVFEEGYLPDAKQGVDYIAGIAGRLGKVGSRIEEATAAFTDRDRIGASELISSGPSGLDLPRYESGATAPIPPVSHIPAGPGPGRSIDPLPRTGIDPLPSAGIDSLPRTELTGSHTAYGGPEDSVNSGDSQDGVTAPETSTPRPARTDDLQNRPGPDTAAPAQPIQLPHVTPAATPPGNHEHTGRTPNRANAPFPGIAPSPASASASGNTRNTPWSGPTPRTPWSNPMSTRRAPKDETLPRVSAPRRADNRPPGIGRPAAARPRRSDSRRIRAPQAAPRYSDTAAMEAARAMAARHGLTIAGFETAGVNEHTVREIAAALDDLLMKYPIELDGIAITDTTARALSGTVPVPTTDGSMMSAKWIILERAELTDSTRPTATCDTAGEVPGTVGTKEYSTVVREFGRVLDAVGGFRARRGAQKALIGEYLRISGHRPGDRLAGVVAGYKRWRGRLPAHGPVIGVFEPATALAEAFTEVELHGSKAGGPARVLHEVLVRTAQNAMVTRSLR